jgi:hypothetical protein
MIGALPAEIGVAKLQLITWAKGNNISLPFNDYGFNLSDLNPMLWSPRDSQALGAFSKWWNDQGYQPKLPATASEPLSDTHRLALAQWAGGEAPTSLQLPGWPTGLPMPPQPPGWPAGLPWPPFLSAERPPALPTWIVWPPPAPIGWPASVPWPPPLPALPGPGSVPTAPPPASTAPATGPLPPAPAPLPPESGPAPATKLSTGLAVKQKPETKSNAVWWVLGVVGVVGVLLTTMTGGGGMQSNPIRLRYRVNYGNGQVWYAPSKREAYAHIRSMDRYQEHAFVQFQDPDTGDWFDTGIRPEAPAARALARRSKGGRR